VSTDFFDEVLSHNPTRYAFEDSAQRNELIDSLVNLRRLLGLTQEDLADRMGVGQPTVSEFENEGSNPKLSTVQRYARALNTRVTFGVVLGPPKWEATR
jgi:transcriptional regulator with XRE-family HTH domain